jgi:hypothetical protein
MGIVATLNCDYAGAWGAEGHRTVGALAARLLEGSHAAVEVRSLLGEISLADAGVWADCVKGVKPDLTYVSSERFPECQVFETPQGQAEMIDFVRRNLRNCGSKADAEECHRQYHYTDLDLPQAQYRAGMVGTRKDDIVSAINAAIRVLEGESAPAPFDIKGEREALLMLAHYVGDIHQPLHVGSMHLNPSGQRLAPGQNALDAQSSTRGGNELIVETRRLHGLWDDIYASQRMDRIDAAWLEKARAVPSTGADIYQFAAIWATESLRWSREAFRAVKFAPRVEKQWPTDLPSDYPARMAIVKKTQLTAAGAHLAEVLRLIWP